MACGSSALESAGMMGTSAMLVANCWLIAKGDTQMKKKVLEWPKQVPRPEFKRRAMKILQEIQKTLLPEHAREIVAINVETGEYTLSPTVSGALSAFRK